MLKFKKGRERGENGEQVPDASDASATYVSFTIVCVAMRVRTK